MHIIYLSWLDTSHETGVILHYVVQQSLEHVHRTHIVHTYILRLTLIICQVSNPTFNILDRLLHATYHKGTHHLLTSSKKSEKKNKVDKKCIQIFCCYIIQIIAQVPWQALSLTLSQSEFTSQIWYPPPLLPGTVKCQQKFTLLNNMRFQLREGSTDLLIQKNESYTYLDSTIRHIGSTRPPACG